MHTKMEGEDKSQISIALVKKLRDGTGLSVAECREALLAASGDYDAARSVLEKRAAAVAEKKKGRALGSGVVSAYIHGGGEIGVLLELLCETDFVAKNDEFKKIAYDLAMHVAAMRPETKEDLLSQEFVKDPSRTIASIVEGITQKFGERSEIGNFVRFSIGGR